MLIEGLAVPPARLRVVVAGSADVASFLESGRVQASHIAQRAAALGRPLEAMEAILDFGCGCGRIARWFSHLSGPAIEGCDYNAELVEWCVQHLPFMQAQRSALMPPLPYPDEHFDLIYAFSVFTHLSREAAGHWMEELHRIVRPGGAVWFTIHGRNYRDRLLPEQRERFDGGEVVVWFPEIEGTNLCGAYWPDSAVPQIIGDGFEIVHHFDAEADPDTAHRLSLPHDAYLVRRL